MEHVPIIDGGICYEEFDAWKRRMSKITELAMWTGIGQVVGPEYY